MLDTIRYLDTLSSHAQYAPNTYSCFRHHRCIDIIVAFVLLIVIDIVRKAVRCTETNLHACTEARQEKSRRSQRTCLHKSSVQARIIINARFYLALLQ